MIDKYYETWLPVLESFKNEYEATCYEKEKEVYEVVDWHPSGYLELTVKMSNGEILVYEFIGGRIYPIRDGRVSSTMEVRRCDDEDNWRNNLSKNLRIRMGRRCISSERLSGLTGISRATLSKYLNGHATPSSYNLEKIAYALECSVAELTLVR
jgi:DNA-binding Xre family transcriptional regulator